MLKKRINGAVAVLLAVSLTLAGCGAPAATETQAEGESQVESQLGSIEEEAAKANQNSATLEEASREIFKLEPHDYEVTTETLPLYLGSTEEENTSEIELAFMDGVRDIPYISPETMRDILTEILANIYEEDGGKNFDLTIEKNGDTVMLTRETNYPVKIDFQNNTIEFYDYDAFIRITDDALLIDAIGSTGFNKEGEASLFQKSDTSFQRYGNPLIIRSGDYGIDLIAKDGEYYLPLQLVSDIILSAYRTNVLYNGQAVCISVGGQVEPLADAYYISDAPTERSDELVAFNYRELCLALDALYGLKEQHGITDFNSLFWMTGLVEPLLSKDPQEAGQALADLTLKYFDDSHSAFIAKSYMMSDDPEAHIGPSCQQISSEMERYSKARDTYYPDGPVPYEEVGNTAFITFDEFIISDMDYYTEKAEDHLEDTVALMIYAYSQITREGSPIKNVVLDLSNNGGGMADAAAYVIGTFIGDGSIALMNTMTGALVSQNYKVDVNLDRKFDELDSLKDYNLFCLTTMCSFSCGNLVPSVLKNSRVVTTLGQTSGGGACVVFRLTTADGNQIQISGYKRLAYMKNGSFYDIDRGVDPDFVIPSPDLFYDRAYLANYVNELVAH